LLRIFWKEILVELPKLVEDFLELVGVGNDRQK
jgi:hypothetical protein